jgi:rsbT co-antagonist protein RsbR
VMPLIGTLDRARGELLLTRLLEGVVAYRASIAILDVTGVPTVDREVADTLVRAAQSLRLIGASVILTGIRSQVAQTLVQLDVDLQGIVILGSLAAGLDHARQRISR